MEQRSGSDNLSRYSAEVSRCERELCCKSFLEYKFEIWTCHSELHLCTESSCWFKKENVSMRVVRVCLYRLAVALILVKFVCLNNL